MEENNIQTTPVTTPKEGSKFGWGLLGFFIPLVGFILFYFMLPAINLHNPSFLVYLVMVIIIFMFNYTIFNSRKDVIEILNKILMLYELMLQLLMLFGCKGTNKLRIKN